MKTYLVTGCAGFIGSNFVHYMLEKYEDIRLINLDKLTYPATSSCRATSATKPWSPT